MLVDYNRYVEDKKAFFEKHKFDFNCDTSPLNEYSEYHKTYIFADHSVWYELIRPCYEDYTVAVKGVTIKGKAKLLQTEYWSTDNSESKVYYEKY